MCIFSEPKLEDVELNSQTRFKSPLCHSCCPNDSETHYRSCSRVPSATIHVSDWILETHVSGGVTLRKGDRHGGGPSCSCIILPLHSTYWGSCVSYPDGAAWQIALGSASEDWKDLSCFVSSLSPGCPEKNLEMKKYDIYSMWFVPAQNRRKRQKKKWANPRQHYQRPVRAGSSCELEDLYLAWLNTFLKWIVSETQFLNNYEKCNVNTILKAIMFIRKYNCILLQLVHSNIRKFMLFRAYNTL